MTKLIMIPARIGSTRLPNKMLAPIGDHSVIQHVVKRALAAEIAEVVVATDSLEIKKAVEAVGGKAAMTEPDLPSGTDRIHAALTQIDPNHVYQHIMNLQGDLPNIEPGHILEGFRVLDEAPEFDAGTLVRPLTSSRELENPNVVKAVLSKTQGHIMRALYFSRSVVPFGKGPHYYHIGLYTYHRNTLEKFVNLPSSPLETSERLEQLRLLENGLTLGAIEVENSPVAIDTPEDLIEARLIMAQMLS